MSAGGIQCGCSQVEAVAARFAGPFDSTKFGRPLDPHQSAESVKLQQSPMKKALNLEDQGLNDGAACRIRTDDLPLTRRATKDHRGLLRTYILFKFNDLTSIDIRTRPEVSLCCGIQGGIQ